jgi:hypothetical protein
MAPSPHTTPDEDDDAATAAAAAVSPWFGSSELGTIAIIGIKKKERRVSF